MRSLRSVPDLNSCYTRKLSYRNFAKMTTRCALYMGALKNFGSPSLRPRLLLQKFLMRFSSDLEMCVQNLKFVALPIPEIIGGTQQIWACSPWIRSRSLFSKIFNGLLFGWTLRMYWPNLKSVALPVPEIIATGVLGGGCKPQSWGRRGHRGSGWYHL